jgi:hypothetical protein
MKTRRILKAFAAHKPRQWFLTRFLLSKEKRPTTQPTAQFFTSPYRLRTLDGALSGIRPYSK